MQLIDTVLPRKRSALTILGISIVFGVAYSMVADSSEDWVGRLNGLLIGIFGGLTIILFELYIFYHPRKIYSFSFMLISKILSYTFSFILIVITVVLITRSLERDVSLLDYFLGDDFHLFLVGEGSVISAYAFSGVVLVITTRQISRKMGPGELFNYVIGKYHRPKKEHRIFLSIDLQNSTRIAEELGELKFHEFLKRYFYDLSRSILMHEGQIYRYVGDQVMISWLLQSGLKNSNAVRCFFDMQNYIEQQENFYQQNFGIVPKFRGVIDMGEILTAEIGLDKQQLVFYGRVMQRMEAIEKVCKKENKNLLISEYAAVPLRQAHDFDFVSFFTMEHVDEGPVQLFTVNPLNTQE